VSPLHSPPPRGKERKEKIIEREEEERGAAVLRVAGGRGLLCEQAAATGGESDGRESEWGLGFRGRDVLIWPKRA
jgi:hypothetical protein